MTRDELPQFFINKGFKVGAEIGVLRGEFTEKLCQAGLKIYAIDPWIADKNHLKENPDYQKVRNALFKSAKNRLEPYACTIIRKTSMEAIEDFKDESLDFVYIDADHHFRYIAEDIVEWSEKVKKGGVVSGHDYHVTPKCQVPFVVDAYAKAFGKKLFITEDDNWYFIK